MTALLLVGAAVLAVDLHRLADEQEQVGACVRQGRVAALAADARLHATAVYLSPARLQPPQRVGDLTSSLLGRAAREARPSVVRARDRCASVAVRAWHGGTRGRRDAVVSYLDARAASLAVTAADGNAYFDTDPALARLRARAFPERTGS